MTTTAGPISAWTTAQLLEATGGRLLSGDPAAVFSDIVTDTRTVSPGAAFVALRGERFDAHDFLDKAVERGAGALILREDCATLSPSGGWSDGVARIAVPDTLAALGAMAAWHRRRMSVAVAAITGSNGKTTTRAMTDAVLSQRFRVMATQGNLNNEVGLPLTLFRLRAEHEWAVVEMGMNHAGEIRRLTRMARPDIGVITNIGPAHIGELGSMDAIMEAKGELVAELPAGAKAVLNADDDRCRILARRHDRSGNGAVIFFGRSADAGVRAEDVREEADGVSFDLVMGMNGKTERVRVALAAAGEFMVSNALAAAAVGGLAGLMPDEVARGLALARPVAGRLVVLPTPAGVTFIDDTYNANPESVKAALSTLVRRAGKHRAMAVLGDMFELGEAAGRLHREVGRHAGGLGLFRLVVVGPHGAELAEGARMAGMAADRVIVADHEEAVEFLSALLADGDWVLVKGSRGMVMEKVLTPLRRWAGDATLSTD